MLTDRYYYNRLSNKEKSIYNELYKSIINLQPVAKVTGCLTMPTVTRIIEALPRYKELISICYMQDEQELMSRDD